jgi:hypothetical protein
MTWQLTGHFFRALFDFGTLTEAGADALKRALLGGVGILIALGLAMTRVYMIRYAILSGAPTAEPYRRALFGDDLMIVAIPMVLTAFVTLFASGSLFPDERDFRILGPLPVRRTQVFGAKLAALVLFNGLFIAAIHLSLVPLMVLTSVGRWADHGVLPRLLAWAAASTAASIFSVLAITAIVGVLVLALSRSHLLSLAAMMKSAIFAGLVLFVPILFRLPASVSRARATWPPDAAWLSLVPQAWFVGLERVLLGSTEPWLVRLAILGLAAGVIVTTIVVFVYAVLFRHFERLMLKPVAGSKSSSRAFASSRSRATAAFLSVHRFASVTLGRSQLHQGVLVGLSAFGVSAAANSLVGAGLLEWGSGAGWPAQALIESATWTPFALMFACGFGVRATLVLPTEYRANWVFRLTESESARVEQMRAVESVAARWVVGVPLAAAVPLYWIAYGSGAALAVPIVACVGLVCVHVVLFDWRRLPFTCSYLPGKRMLAYSLIVAVAAYNVLTGFGVGFVRAAAGNTSTALWIGSTLLLAAWLLRRRRMAAWRETPLLFEDEFPDQPLELRL